MTDLLVWLDSPESTSFVEGVGGPFLRRLGFTDELGTDLTVLSPEQQNDLRLIGHVAMQWGWLPVNNRQGESVGCD